MSNQNLPKLFFFNIEPWKEVYNDRFLLKQLQEKGFPIGKRLRGSTLN